MLDHINSFMPHRLLNVVWADRTKWGKFGVILVLLLIASTAASLVARIVLFEKGRKSAYQIALIAPMSGELSATGRSLLSGAELQIKQVNAAGGVGGLLLELAVYDDGGDPERARSIAEAVAQKENVVATIGPWQARSVDRAAAVLDEFGMATVAIDPAAYDLSAKHATLFTIGYSAEDETRFIANYVRNILGEKLVSVLADEASAPTADDLFTSTFERFGIPIRHRWTFNSKSPDAQAQIAALISQIRDTPDSGTIFLAASEIESAQIIRLMQDMHAFNKVVGPHMLATQSFTEAFKTSEPARFTNGVMTTAPLMFDTTNQAGQDFQSSFIAAYHAPPDWIAALAFESAHILTKTLGDALERNKSPRIDGLRKEIVKRLTETARPGQAIEGVTGATAFDDTRRAAKPIKVGIYDGQHVISALTQLQPIAPGEVTNYIQQVREGRALYVNDRFMYRTNVVYSGLQIKAIRDFDPVARTFEMDFAIWFRYRGDFSPEDVVFDNALKPIVLDHPDAVEKVGDLIYKRFLVTAKFNADYRSIERSFGTELLGTSFRHRTLGQNNVIYVVDIVGSGMVDGTSYLDILRNDQVLAPPLGLALERAWIAQDVARTGGFGSLTYVGYGKPRPEFSQIEAGVLVRGAALSLSDLVPDEYLIYILIFAALGSLFAHVMDRKRDGSRLFWNLQSWLLRLLSWPLALTAAGTLVLNFAFANLESYWTDVLVPVYASLTWVLGAVLFAMATERFVWIPLEQSTKHKVPGSVRAGANVGIFLFAGFGIVAFVMHKELTSLLATSGLVAMIVGLAIQANISNVFSGIVLNLERPFLVGDYIGIGTESGRVVDITWRTTVIAHSSGQIVRVPNAKVASTDIVKLFPLASTSYKQTVNVPTSPSYEPELVCELLLRAATNCSLVLADPKPEARLVNIVVTGEATVANYRLTLHFQSYQHYDARFEHSNAIWQSIWSEFNRSNMELVVTSPGRLGVSSVPAVRSSEAS